MSADNQLLSQAPEPLGAVPDQILRAITLFLPRPEFSTRIRTTTQDDVRITLEKSTQASQRSDDLTVTRLVKTLKNDAHPHLMLLTSDGTTTPATVVGVYFPGPLWLGSNEREKCEFKTGTSHLLFQLGPQFRLLRWTCPGIPLTDIVNTHEEALSLEAIAASDETSPTSNKAYWVGDPERIGPGLQIDPETKSALLTSNLTDANIGRAAWYNDVGRDSDRGDEAPKEPWEVTVKLGQLHFFRVSCRIDADLATGRIIRAKDQARYMREAAKPRIEGEELKKRIQGFGSTS
ncbi:hypothetical protein N7510_004823 [Penicillium lagena]|uniref:uncharacterized protein n=1 Tax=Penicillium lagena TaxID=94218 RepID=UPI00254065BE|nr:uncharacterized protein N7510_004823 [Penicillium lagena]KAJ5620839.1 hypothetical protein N7510_004823 [Penicillium lagena]